MKRIWFFLLLFTPIFTRAQFLKGDHLGIPVYSTSTTPILANGEVIANTDSNKLQFWLNGTLFTVGGAGGGGASYSFSNSLVNTGGIVTLVNDNATPGNSKYYGTNGSGTLGYFTLPGGLSGLTAGYMPVASSSTSLA